MMRVADVDACAAAQMEHLPQLVRTLGLTDDQSSKLRRMAGTFFPILRK